MNFHVKELEEWFDILGKMILPSLRVVMSVQEVGS